MGNWLTKEQARELPQMPDRYTLKGKRDCCSLALLVGCALRRRELDSVRVENIQMRENRWEIIDLRGKGDRIRTVAVPMWVKHGVNAWQAAAKIEEDPLLRLLKKVGRSAKASVTRPSGPSSRNQPKRSASVIGAVAQFDAT